MKLSDKIKLKQSERRARLAELAAIEEPSEEQRTEIETETRAYQDAETRYQAAVISEAGERGRVEEPADAEARERAELRAKTSIGRFLAAGIAGRRLDGAEEEFRQAVGAAERTIPLDAFERPARRDPERREDAATGAPATIGINMAEIVPAAFAGSVAPRLGVTMPRVASGQYSIPRLTTNLTAGAQAKGDPQESTAAAFTIISAKPKRISARLTLQAEDLAEVGIPGFEAALRANLMDVLAETLDTQVLRGSGAGANIAGLAGQLQDDADPVTVVTFPGFVDAVAGLIDGKWATTLGDLRLACNAGVYRKLAGLFQEPRFVNKGNGQANVSDAATPSIETAIDWAGRALGGLFCNARMEAAAANVSACIAVRSGMMVEPAAAAVMPAVCPTWGDIAIADPYSDSGSATEHYSLHILLGNVLIRTPDAYAEIRIKTA